MSEIPAATPSTGGKTVAIMQPYFCPYVGYFQLVAAADLFVVYDNIQYTKKGWMNRNRYLSGGRDAWMTVPLRAGSDFLDVRDREVAPDFEREKLLNRLREAYRRAPGFEATFPLVERIVRHEEPNLFRFVLFSLRELCAHLAIATPIAISSELPIDHGLRAQDKVLAICREVGASTYVNPIGGTELYDRRAFASAGVTLRFLKARPFEYPQLGEPFVPWLSIVDVLMFNPVAAVKDVLRSNYDLL